MAVTVHGVAQEGNLNHVGNPLDYDSLQLVETVADEDIQNMNPVKDEGIQQVHLVEDENIERVDLVENEGNEIQLFEILADKVVQLVQPAGAEGSDVVGPAEDEVPNVFTHRTDVLVSSIDDEHTSVMNLRHEAATPAVDPLDNQNTRIAFYPMNETDAQLYDPATGKSNSVDNVEDLLAKMIKAIVKNHLEDCHLVWFTSHRQSSELLHGLR